MKNINRLRDTELNNNEQVIVDLREKMNKIIKTMDLGELLVRTSGNIGGASLGFLVDIYKDIMDGRDMEYINNQYKDKFDNSIMSYYYIKRMIELFKDKDHISDKNIDKPLEEDIRNKIHNILNEKQITELLTRIGGVLNTDYNENIFKEIVSIYEDMQNFNVDYSSIYKRLQKLNIRHFDYDSFLNLFAPSLSEDEYGRKLDSLYIRRLKVGDILKVRTENSEYEFEVISKGHDIMVKTKGNGILDDLKGALGVFKKSLINLREITESDKKLLSSADKILTESIDNGIHAEMLKNETLARKPGVVNFTNMGVYTIKPGDKLYDNPELYNVLTKNDVLFISAIDKPVNMSRTSKIQEFEVIRNK